MRKKGNPDKRTVLEHFCVAAINSNLYIQHRVDVTYLIEKHSRGY